MIKRYRLRERGFSLIEMIVVIVITGIIARAISVFMAGPVSGYLDTARRGDMSDAADGALRRIAYEIRAAVPNSVRVSGATSVEFIPTSDGGRYRRYLSGVTGNVLSSVSTDESFDVLGPAVTGSIGDFLVINNTGTAPQEAYDGGNRRTINAEPGATVSFTGTGTAFPNAANGFTVGQHFLIVPSAGPVTFACTGLGTSSGVGTGVLHRYTDYGFTATQIAVPGGGSTTSTLLIDGLSACSFTYDSANNGSLFLVLTLTKGGESITLAHKIHVDNTP
jgi:MSHA biogenesis protein MshO